MSSFPLQQGAAGVPEQLEQPVPGAILLRQDLQGEERGEEHDEFISATFLALLLTDSSWVPPHPCADITCTFSPKWDCSREGRELIVLPCYLHHTFTLNAFPSLPPPPRCHHRCRCAPQGLPSLLDSFDVFKSNQQDESIH